MKIKKIKADLILLHAPSYFDFRKENKVYFPYMSTSGDVPITPLYEYIPIGFKTIKKFLEQKGHNVEIVNLSSIMLLYPEIDLKSFFSNIEAKIIGIDLHWMVHVQGSLETASVIKSINKDISILFGGISSTYFSNEIITYPFVDMVMQGYDTHIPMEQLLNEIKDDRNFSSVPNLIWKNKSGEIIKNKFFHTPPKYSIGIDWSDFSPDNKSFLPISEILSTHSAGCMYNCGWCGGSREAFKRIYKCSHNVAYKELSDIKNEFESIQKIDNIDTVHYYGCGAYNEPLSRFEFILDQVKNCNFKSVNFEQFILPPENLLKKFAECNKKTTITLSPESHDIKVSKLAGRGTYSMEEMENWIDKALSIGIYQIDIWFFVGMPEQDQNSVIETINYCDKLLRRFQNQRVFPFICPMIPFLDPGSNFFTNPEKYGYILHCKSVEEHRTAMKNASLINRLNYSTKWLDRKSIIFSSYNAIIKLNELKGKYGLLPSEIVTKTIQKLQDALNFIDIVHKIDSIPDDEIKNRELEKISEEIYKRNKEVFFSGVANQAFPVERHIGNRWIDYGLKFITTDEFTK